MLCATLSRSARSAGSSSLFDGFDSLLRREGKKPISHALRLAPEPLGANVKTFGKILFPRPIKGLRLP